jgi:hypothetical protein
MHDPARAEPWTRLALAHYRLEEAGAALAAVAAGSVVKALIDPAAR